MIKLSETNPPVILQASNTVLADHFVSSRMEDDQGCYWVTLHTGSPTGQRESILHGNAGIVLYLLLCFQQTGHGRYLQIAESAAGRIARNLPDHAVHHFGILSGNAGISFVFLYLYRLTQKTEWRQRAVDSMARCNEGFITSRHTADSLGDGRAGLLVMLLLLHRADSQEWMKAAINECIIRMIARSRVTNKGVYWPDFYHHVAGLNSLSSGSAGIGLALLYAGKVTGEDTLISLALKAYKYTTSTFDKEAGRWPDFRKPLDSADRYYAYKEKLATGDTAFFSTPGYTDGLAEGSAGILLSYVAGYFIHGSGYLKRIIQDMLPAVFQFGDAARISRKNTAGILEKILQTEVPRDHGDSEIDPGGSPVKLALEGIMNLAKNNIAALLTSLSATFDRTREEALVQTADLNKTFFNTHFLRTVHVAGIVAAREWKTFFDTLAAPKAVEEKSFSLFMKGLKRTLDPVTYDRVYDLYKIERRKFLLEKEGGSHALRHITEIMRMETKQKFLNLHDEEMFNEIVVINPDLEFHQSKWDWEKKFDATQPAEAADSMILFYRAVNGKISVHFINSVQQSLLSIFSEPVMIRDGIGQYVQLFDNTSVKDITMKLLDAVKYLVEQAWLLPVKKPYGVFA